jgi:hypothetical protein
MLERDIATQIIKVYAGIAFIFNIHGHEMQRAGLPDLHITSAIWTGYIELKRDKRKPTKLQEMIMRRIIACRGKAFVVRNHGDGLQIEMWNGIILGHCKYVDLLKTLSTL